MWSVKCECAVCSSFLSFSLSFFFFYFPLNWLSILEKIPGEFSSGFLSSLFSWLGFRRRMRLNDPARGWNIFFDVPSLSTSFSILPKELLFSFFDVSSLEHSIDLIGFWRNKDIFNINFLSPRVSRTD